MSVNAPTIGELFAGYGGIGLGLHQLWPDAEVRWVSDVDKGANKILEHRLPNVPNLGDITAIDWPQVEPVDIITGGSPCQDLSHAGKRAGMKAGTRSGLWASMCDAIDILRPSLVVWENVRGALSADATTGEVESCEFCMADRGDQPMRALGRVLGDLADIGYDAAWVGLRAADVGACHGRFRVFVLAWPADAAGIGREWLGSSRLRGAGLADGGRGRDRASVAPPLLRTVMADEDGGGPLHPDVAKERGQTLRLTGQILALTGNLLPTPVTEPDTGNGHARNLGKEARMMPTPRATDGTKGGPNPRGSSGDLMLPSAVAQLLPTPAVNDMGANKTPDAWDEWTAAMQARHGNGNGHGKSLEIEAARLANEGDEDAIPADGTAGQDLPCVRDGIQQAPIQRTHRGRDSLLIAGDVLAGVREHEGDSASGHLPMAGAPIEAPRGVRGVLDDDEPSRSPHRQERDEQRAAEPGGALLSLSPETALAGGSRRAVGGDPCGCDPYGPYAAAVHRWEVVLGRPAPFPTEPTGREGKARLSARLTEFMMGLPDGWITDVPGITRNEALKACGNGVVPQQCAEAVRYLLDVRATVARALKVAA